MWIFLNDAFLSVVQSDRDPGLFAVRARQRQDLRNAFPSLKPEQIVEGDRHQDYAYRAFLPKAEVELLLMQRLHDLDYTNFKASIAKTAKGEERHDFYLAVWAKAVSFQNGLFRPKPKRKWG